MVRKGKRKRTGAADRGGESRDDRERLGVMPDTIGETNGNDMENTLMRSAPCPHCGAQMMWTQNASNTGSGEAVSAAYRCVNGHVLDSSTTRQCPACGVHDTTLLRSADGRQDFRCARCGQAFTFPREFGDKPLSQLEEAVIAPLRADLAGIPDGSTRQNGSTGSEETFATTSRKLEEMASNLDDLSVTLEEIKEEITDGNRRETEKLDKVHTEMERAADAIEESLPRHTPGR
jgi:predicted RNA-binding Zn-ribbon protein involved in translation (DUF1610 family)